MTVEVVATKALSIADIGDPASPGYAARVEAWARSAAI